MLFNRFHSRSIENHNEIQWRLAKLLKNIRKCNVFQRNHWTNIRKSKHIQKQTKKHKKIQKSKVVHTIRPILTGGSVQASRIVWLSLFFYLLMCFCFFWFVWISLCCLMILCGILCFPYVFQWFWTECNDFLMFFNDFAAHGP